MRVASRYAVTLFCTGLYVWCPGNHTLFCCSNVETKCVDTDYWRTWCERETPPAPPSNLTLTTKEKSHV